MTDTNITPVLILWVLGRILGWFQARSALLKVLLCLGLGVVHLWKFSFLCSVESLLLHCNSVHCGLTKHSDL